MRKPKNFPQLSTPWQRRKNCLPGYILFLAIAVSVSAFSTAESIGDPYDILAASRSVFVTLPQDGPESYIADLDISGIAVDKYFEQLRNTSEPLPRFKAYFESPVNWKIHCAGTPAQKQLVAQILNLMAPFYLPFTMSPEYQEEEVTKLRVETRATIEEETIEGIDCWKIILEPIEGKTGFNATNNNGSKILTTRSIFWIGKQKNIIIKNLSNIRSLDTGTGGDDLVALISTSWEEFAGMTLPSSMIYNINGIDLYEQRMRYRTEGTYILPDTRELLLFSTQTIPFMGRIKIDFTKYFLDEDIPAGIF